MCTFRVNIETKGYAFLKMKLLHTSDWHLGHRLHEQSQYEEQQGFLSWLINFISAQQIDILLVAGDIFDTGAPSAQSLTLYYNFLVDLKTTACKHIIITGGNHDAPGTLNAPKEILKALNIHVVGKATEEVKDEVLEIDINGEKVIVAAVPYLRDQDIRRAVAGESFSEIGDRYKNALINHYKEVAAYCEDINKENNPVIGMGHLFAIGGSTTDSEQTIYVGNAGDIGADDFPATFDYIALGHLHRCQRINDKIRYSGTPYVLSFSEVNNEKKVITLDIRDKSITDINEHKMPAFRTIKRVKGPFDECITELKQLALLNESLVPYAEVILDVGDNNPVAFSDIHKAVEDLNIKVLKVSLSQEQERWDKLLEDSLAKDVKDFTPMEVFHLRCQEQNFDIESRPEIQDAFHEILQLAKKQ